MVLSLQLLPYPHLVVWKKDILDDSKGTTIAPVVVLRDGESLESSAYYHECEHVRQYYNVAFFGMFIIALIFLVSGAWSLWPLFLTTALCHPLCYTVFPYYRYRCELYAYAEQIKRHDKRHWAYYIEHYTWFILTKYHLESLELTRADVIDDLKGEIGAV